jgi:c-di-GMP-related signal transduction protein
MWKIDSEIEEMNLDEASRQTPKLHSKYLELYSLAKLQLKKVEMNQKILLKDKWLYYNGKMDQKTLQAKGWNPDPLDGLKILKGDMDYYYDSDPEIQRSEELIQYYKTVVETLSDITDNIKWRHQTIRNMIEWRKFTSGG